MANHVERLALHGLSLGAWQRFSDAGFRHCEVVNPGFKYNMTDVEASLGLHQLPRLDGWIDRRAELWERDARIDVIGDHPPLDGAGVHPHGILPLGDPAARERLDSLFLRAT